MKNYKITIYEVGNDHPIITKFYNAVSKEQVIKHYGLNEPDIESYKIEEIPD